MSVLGRTLIDEATLRRYGLWGFWRWMGERFTPAGRWFLLASIGWFLSGMNSLDLQAYVPVLYAFAFWLLALCALPLVRSRLRLNVQHEERVSAGEILPVHFHVEGGAGRADSYRLLPYRAPRAMQAVPPEGLSLTIAADGHGQNLEGALRCGRRGVYAAPTWQVQTDFPFGLMRAYQLFAGGKRLLVYPRFTPLAHCAIPPGRRFHPGGVALASHGGDSCEFLGNRDYREGDALRDIDWRATARLGRPIVREYREEYFLRVAVVLDTHLPAAAGVAEKLSNDEAFESAVSLCAAVGDYMARCDYIVDILAAGPNLYHLTAGRSLAYLDQILDILACVDANPDEPFSVLEPEIAANLAQINTLVCIFLDWTDSRRAFLEQLEHSGAGLKVVIVRDSPTSHDIEIDRRRGLDITLLQTADCVSPSLNL